MPIALRAAQGTAGASTSATSATGTVPTGVVDGDVMVMIVAVNGASHTITTPTGWTLLDSANTGASTPTIGIYWRVASTEPATYTINYTTGASSNTVIIALSGASSTALVAAQHSIQQNTTGSTTINAATLGTFTSNNGIDIFLGTATGIITTPAAPTNYTQPTNGTASSTGTATTGITSGVAYRALTAVTTVGAISATWTAIRTNDGAHVFIFEVTAVAPTVTTTAVSDTGPTEVTVGGNVTADGGATVTERGLVWATAANPTTADTKVIDGGSGTGAFTDNIIGLATSTTYHYRAYAINSVGTSYGADIQFTTSGQMLNNYQFIKAGNGMSVSEKIR